MRKALKVLAPLEEELKKSKIEGRRPKALGFNEVLEVRAVPARVAPPSAVRPAVAPQPVTTAPLEGDVSEPAVGQKLDIRARVDAMPTMFKQKDRPDLEDARALVMTYLKEPQRIQHPLWTLLVCAEEHAAQRTREVNNAWSMDGADSINEGLEVLLNTPVLLTLKLVNPVQFEAVCQAYDGLFKGTAATAR